MVNYSAPPQSPPTNNCSSESSENNQSSDNLPDPAKLQRVHDILLDNVRITFLILLVYVFLNIWNYPNSIFSFQLPKIFTEPLNYSIYHKDLIFENRIRGKTTV